MDNKKINDALQAGIDKASKIRAKRAKKMHNVCLSISACAILIAGFFIFTPNRGNASAGDDSTTEFVTEITTQAPEPVIDDSATNTVKGLVPSTTELPKEPTTYGYGNENSNGKASTTAAKSGSNTENYKDTANGIKVTFKNIKTTPEKMRMQVTLQSTKGPLPMSHFDSELNPPNKENKYSSTYQLTLSALLDTTNTNRLSDSDCIVVEGNYTDETCTTYKGTTEITFRTLRDELAPTQIRPFVITIDHVRGIFCEVDHKGNAVQEKESVISGDTKWTYHFSQTIGSESKTDSDN